MFAPVRSAGDLKFVFMSCWGGWAGHGALDKHTAAGRGRQVEKQRKHTKKKKKPRALELSSGLLAGWGWPNSRGRGKPNAERCDLTSRRGQAHGGWSWVWDGPVWPIFDGPLIAFQGLGCGQSHRHLAGLMNAVGGGEGRMQKQG
jgi:hypothetical protein